MKENPRSSGGAERACHPAYGAEQQQAKQRHEPRAQTRRPPAPRKREAAGKCGEDDNQGAPALTVADERAEDLRV
jgi:hypothetical protein